MHDLKLRFDYTMRTAIGQDGAIFGDELFRFDGSGNCKVYSMTGKEMTAEFRLERTDEFKPHSNAVFFGNEKYAEDDEFPILYTNLYNSYAKEADRREGTLCAYRITRDKKSFKGELVQIIKIGFVNDRSLWKSMDDESDVRPYGNFILDPDTNKLYAFVMRDKERVTRYFEFAMPSVKDGEVCEKCGLPVVTLGADKILAKFDGAYSNYIQGACVHEGRLYSVEGFNCQPGDKKPNYPRLQIMDLCAHEQYADIDLFENGLYNEPEFIYPHDGKLYYSDCMGHVFIFTITE